MATPPQISWLERNIVWLFVALTLVSLLLPAGIFWRHAGNPATAGSLGDLIGGASGPVINIVAALLVYLSFRKQTQANEIILAQIDLDEERSKNALYLGELSAEIYRLEESLSALDFVSPADGVAARGLHAIKKMLASFSSSATDKEARLRHFNQYLFSNSSGQELLYLLIKCREIHSDTATLLTDVSYQRIARKRLALFYRFKLSVAVKEVLDYVRDEIYHSNTHADAALAALEDHLILRQLYGLERELTGVGKGMA